MPLSTEDGAQSTEKERRGQHFKEYRLDTTLPHAKLPQIGSKEKNHKHKHCELFFPSQSPGSPQGGNPRKMGKNYKMLLPGPTHENGEKLPEKITKNAPKIHFL